MKRIFRREVTNDTRISVRRKKLPVSPKIRFIRIKKPVFYDLDKSDSVLSKLKRRSDANSVKPEFTVCIRFVYYKLNHHDRSESTFLIKPIT